MPNLGDFIGQLMAEIAIARAQADLEALRIAETYASHHLLKQLPVARVRLAEVKIDVPVVVAEVGDTDEAMPRGGLVIDGELIDPAERSERAVVKLRALFLKIYNAEKSKVGIRDGDAVLMGPLEETIQRFMGVSDIGSELTQLVDAMTETTIATLSAKSEGAAPRRGRPSERKHVPDQKRQIALQRLHNSLPAAARQEFLKLRVSPPRLVVLASAAELSEVPPDHLMRLQFTLNEEGLQWHTSEEDGVRKDSLTIE